MKTPVGSAVVVGEGQRSGVRIAARMSERQVVDGHISGLRSLGSLLRGCNKDRGGDGFVREPSSGSNHARVVAFWKDDGWMTRLGDPYEVV